jgi:hypothetical protein
MFAWPKGHSAIPPDLGGVKLTPSHRLPSSQEHFVEITNWLFLQAAA